MPSFKMQSRVVHGLLNFDIESSTATVQGFGFRLVVIGLLLLLSTHCLTTLRFSLQRFRGRRYRGKEPLTLPYALPGIGSALSMIRNPHGFFDSIVRKVDDGEPLRMRLGNVHAYLIHGTRNVQQVFKCSKELTFEEFALRVAQKVKRLPSKDAALVAKDVSGSSRQPLTETRGEDRIWRKFHEIYESHLIGSTAVSSLTEMFINIMVDQLSTVGTNGLIECGIDKFMKHHMFRASTIALAGEGVFDADPNFAETFWEYDEDFMSLLYGLPKFLCRRGWNARDKCLKTCPF